jgi:hypothetical protein
LAHCAARLLISASCGVLWVSADHRVPLAVVCRHVRSGWAVSPHAYLRPGDLVAVYDPRERRWRSAEVQWASLTLVSAWVGDIVFERERKDVRLVWLAYSRCWRGRGRLRVLKGAA